MERTRFRCMTVPCSDSCSGKRVLTPLPRALSGLDGQRGLRCKGSIVYVGSWLTQLNDGVGSRCDCQRGRMTKRVGTFGAIPNVCQRNSSPGRSRQPESEDDSDDPLQSVSRRLSAFELIDSISRLAASPKLGEAKETAVSRRTTANLSLPPIRGKVPVARVVDAIAPSASGATGGWGWRSVIRHRLHCNQSPSLAVHGWRGAARQRGVRTASPYCVIR
jgi:hypothetical protein